MGPSEIKALRMELGISRQEFARRMHVAIATVKAWERGIHSPGKRHHERLQRLQLVVTTMGAATDWNASNILGLRADLGIGRTEFAHRVGTYYGTVWSWENGKSRPSMQCSQRLTELSVAAAGTDSRREWTGRHVMLLRKRLGLTQRELAQLLELSGRGTVSRWERGCQTPSPRMCRRLDDLDRGTTEGGTPEEQWNCSRIAELMDRLGFDRRQFAALLGVSACSVWEWVNGKASPCIDAKRRLAAAEGMDSAEAKLLLAYVSPDRYGWGFFGWGEYPS